MKRLLYISVITVSLACPDARAQEVSRVPYNFSNLPIVGGGFITGIIFHPGEEGLAYARTDIGGAYRWSATDRRWVALADWVGMDNANLLGIESIAIDPSNPNLLYIAAGTYTNASATNGAMLLSSDQGRHFEVVPLPFKLGGNEDGRFAGERLSVDPLHPSILYFGTRKDGLWHSFDAGKHWQRVESFPSISSNGVGIVFSLFAPSKSGTSKSETIYVGSSAAKDNLFRSSDGGAHWETVPGPPTGLMPNHAQLSHDGWLYLTYGNAPGPNGMTGGAVWKFNTTSGEWKDITPDASTQKIDYGFGALALDAKNSSTVMVATMDRWNVGDTIYRSVDAGKHWTSLMEQSSRDASISPFLAGADGKVGMGHWIGALAVDPFQPGHVLYGTGETLWSSADVNHADRNQPTHWSVGALGIEETAVLTLVSPPSGDHLFSGLGDIGCFRHEDVQKSSIHQVLRNPSLSNCDTIDYSALHPSTLVRAGRTWKTSSHGGYSLDGGHSWTQFSSEPAGTKEGGRILLSADQSIILWANRVGVFRSDDWGRQWQPVAMQSQHLTFAVDRREPHTFYAFDQDKGKLYRSQDARLTFTLQRSGLSLNARLWASPTEAGILWFGSNDGLYRAARETVSRIAGVNEVYSLGFGMAMQAAAAPTIFLAGKIGTRRGIFRSTDNGLNWEAIDSPEQRFGWITAVEGDLRVFGRVYLGTNGRGVIVGEPEQ